MTTQYVTLDEAKKIAKEIGEIGGGVRPYLEDDNDNSGSTSRNTLAGRSRRRRTASGSSITSALSMELMASMPDSSRRRWPTAQRAGR